jgi:hypothetical protein
VRQNKNARQSILFAVRGEKKLPPFCAHGSVLGANEGGGGLVMEVEKKKYYVFFLCRASLIKCTAKYLFAVRLMKNARQRFSRTAKVSFPVV